MRKWLVEIGGYLITDGSFGVSPGGRLSAGGHIFAFGVAPPPSSSSPVGQMLLLYYAGVAPGLRRAVCD
jgi:hypothetical protein